MAEISIVIERNKKKYLSIKTSFIVYRTEETTLDFFKSKFLRV